MAGNNNNSVSLAQLSQAIASAVSNALRSTANGVNQGFQQGLQANALQDTINSLRQNIRSLSERVKEYDQYSRTSALATARLNKQVQSTVSASSGSIKEMMKALSKHRDAMLEQESFTEQHNKRLLKSVNETIKKYDHVSELSDKNKNELKKFIDQVGDMNDAMSSIKKKFEDQAKAAGNDTKKMEAATAEYQKSIRNLMNSRHKYPNNTYAREIEGKIKSALGIEPNKKVPKGNSAQKVNDYISGMISQQSEIVKNYYGTLGHISTRAAILGSAFKSLSSLTSNYIGRVATVSSLYAMLIDGIKGAYGEFRSMGSMGLATQWASLSFASLKLGLSFEEVIKKLQTAGQIGVKMGAKEYVEALGFNNTANYKLGLNAKDTANLNEAAIKLGTLYGADAKNRLRLNKIMTDNVSEFERLRSITGENVDMFIEFKNQLLTATEFQDRASSMNVKERYALEKNIMAQYEQARLIGLNNEQAQQALRLSQQQQAARVKNRLTGAAQIQMISSLSGMGVEGAQAAELLRKRNRTTDEDAYLREFFGNLQKKTAEGQFSNNYGIQELYDSVIENLDSSVKPMLTQTGRDVNLAEPKRVTPEEAARRKEEGRLSDTTAGLLKSIDFIANAMNSNLGKILIATTGILAIMIARHGGAILSGISSMIKGLPGFIGRIAGGAVSIGKSIVGGAMSATSKIAGMPLMQSAGSAISKGTGAVIGAGKGLASRAVGIGSKAIGATTSAGSALLGAGKSAIGTIGGLGKSAIGSIGLGSIGKGVVSKLPLIGTLLGAGLTASEINDISKSDKSDKEKRKAIGGSAGSFGGSLAGASLGFMFGGPAGAVVGGILGAIGGKDLGTAGGGLYDSLMSSPSNVSSITSDANKSVINNSKIAARGMAPVQSASSSTAAHAKAKDDVKQQEATIASNKVTDTTKEMNDNLVNIASLLTDLNNKISELLNNDTEKVRQTKLAALGIDDRRKMSNALATPL